MKTIKLHNLISLILTLTIIFGCVIFSYSAYSPLTVRADETLQFDQTDVLDDLQGMEIHGIPFNIRDYPFDDTRDLEVIAFAEYGYNYAMSDEIFGLYIYVYNPQNLLIDYYSEQNKISTNVLTGDLSNYTKYGLIYLSRSEDNRFLKFKIDLPKSIAGDILAKGTNERLYSIGEIELKQQGNHPNANAYNVARLYRYSGYAKGLGKVDTVSTLVCLETEIETLHLSVKPTFFRPEGGNGNSAYTKDTLHSVYFSVPDSCMERSGEMYSVHATWLNALLAPALVTGNLQAFTAIAPYLGTDIGAYNTELKYCYIGDPMWQTGIVNPSVTAGYVYNCPDTFMASDGWLYRCYSLDFDKQKKNYRNTENRINTLALMFSTGGGANSADSYKVTGETILSRIRNYSKNYGSDCVLGKYSRDLFSQVDSKFTDVVLTADNVFNLNDAVISRSYWQKLFGRYSASYGDGFNGIKAIYRIDPERDLAGSHEDIAARLYVDVRDVEELRHSVATATSQGKSVYLFRYQVSEYFAQEARCLRWDDPDPDCPTLNYVDTNAYFFQETVNLDFDIIDITFRNEEGYTVIPCVMQPIDIVHDSEPPLIVILDYVKNRRNLWIIVVIVVAIAVYLIYRKKGSKK